MAKIARMLLVLFLERRCEPQLQPEAFSLSHVFGNHMVLQRDRTYSIFGFSSGLHRSKVSVSVTSSAGETISQGQSNISLDGAWVVKPSPSVPAGGPFSVTITSGRHVKTLKDVYFGDVFFCSGQSNMQFPVSADMDTEHACAEADNYPLIRMFVVEAIQYPNSPQDVQQIPHDGSSWGISSRSTLCPYKPVAWGQGYFSAACYFHGRELQKAGDDRVPIGLVEAAWGSTAIQVWEGPDAVEQCEKLAAPDISGFPDFPTGFSQLWRTMVAPLQSMAFVGFLWYQGEENIGQSQQYGCMFKALINDWRSKFLGAGQNTSFTYVELAAVPSRVGHGLYASLRLAQAEALSLPMVGRAAALDLGDSSSPYTALHPRWKQELGRRSALQHMKFQGSLPKGAVADAPILRQTNFTDGHFLFVLFSARVRLIGTKGCSRCCNGVKQGQKTDLFQVSYDGKHWQDATFVKLEGETVSLRVPTWAQLISYALQDYPECLLFSSESLRDMLPVSQFVKNISLGPPTGIPPSFDADAASSANGNSKKAALVAGLMIAIISASVALRYCMATKSPRIPVGVPSRRDVSFEGLSPLRGGPRREGISQRDFMMSDCESTPGGGIRREGSIRDLMLEDHV